MSSSYVQATIIRSLEKFFDDDEIKEFLSGSFSQSIKLGSSSRLMCANSNAGEAPQSCANLGLHTCSKCHLVKYCGRSCQLSHWSIHRKDCKAPYLKSNWQPQWVKEDRTPAFLGEGPPLVQFGTQGNYVWGNVPAIDCMNIAQNEGTTAASQDFNLCFAASGDIRNMVRTVNSLPNDYSGKCDILINDINPLVMNRNLVILHALLSSDHAVDQAAEFAVHLMYSAALPPALLAHLYRSINSIYGKDAWKGQPFVSARWSTPGRREIRATQHLHDMELPLQMFLSNYELEEALENMRHIMLNPARVDYRDRHISGLEPSHRMGFMHFRKSGILAPFSYDTSHFTQPNRLLFSAEGKWLTLDNANPLEGWSVPAVLASGKRHGVDPQDILGCLFFHVKDEFETFARRLKDFNITIHITGFDARSLSEAITGGAFEPFGSNCFDRIETSNMADYIGVPQVLGDWSPLLNRRNKHAALLVYLMNWYSGQENDMAYSDSRVAVPLMERACAAIGISTYQCVEEGKFGPYAMRIMQSLDTFHDNSTNFRKFLLNQGCDNNAKSHAVRLRQGNRIHTKRLGIPLNKQHLEVPDVSPKEYYELYCLGGASSPLRFLEFETV